MTEDGNCLFTRADGMYEAILTKDVSEARKILAFHVPEAQSGISSLIPLDLEHVIMSDRE